jgi:hypothetical protein
MTEKKGGSTATQGVEAHWNTSRQSVNPAASLRKIYQVVINTGRRCKVSPVLFLLRPSVVRNPPMSTSNKSLNNSLFEALAATTRAGNAASTARLSAIAGSNNPRFWDPKIRSEQWYDTNGEPFSLVFPALIEPTGKHSRIDPYFTLPTLKQVRNHLNCSFVC